MNTNVGFRENVQWQSSASRISAGLEFRQNNELGLVEIIDNRPTDTKIKDAAQSVQNHFKVLYDRCVWRFENRNTAFSKVAKLEDGTLSYPVETLPWNSSEESSGLYFFIHVLHGSPADWQAYKNEVAEDPKSHTYTPKVVARGNCGIEVAGKPLLEALENYLRKFPGKPVTLIGSSNGGRLAVTYLETNLDPSVLGSSRLTVVSLASVIYGTKLIDNLNSAYLPSFLDKQLEREFAFGSESAKKHLFAWKSKQDVWNEQDKIVHHLFCASTEDVAVRDNSSSLPYHESASSTYIVVSGESHTSIVDTLRPDVMQWIRLNR